jgi:hypothetical protein
MRGRRPFARGGRSTAGDLGCRHNWRRCVGRVGGILLPSAPALGVRPAAGSRPEHRRRFGGGCVQASDRPADETDGRTLARASRLAAT